MKKIAILNPQTGEYVFNDNANDAAACLAEIALSVYLNNCHGQLYNIVNIDDTGSETWSTPDGNEILSPTQIKELIAKRAITSAMPVTKLGNTK